MPGKNPSLFYLLFAWSVRRALSLFCTRIDLCGDDPRKGTGPLLLAANHPDSFLDAIVIASRFRQPVYFLARGELFRRPLIRKSLLAFRMIPVFQPQPGKKSVTTNEAMVSDCVTILADNGIILVFSEGSCVHQHTLRPLKKITTRIALAAAAEVDVPSSFRVVPVAIRYDSFTRFGKKINVRFLPSISPGAPAGTRASARDMAQLHARLSETLSGGLTPDRDPCEKKAVQPHDWFVFFILFVPAAAGWMLHRPLYWPVRGVVRNATKGTVYYDAVLFSALFIIYPFYYLVLNGLAFLFLPAWWLLVTIPLPCWARLYLLWKNNPVRG